MSSTPFTLARRMVQAMALALVLASCVSVPPPDDAIAQARSQLQAARDAGAADYAPVDLDFAQARMDRAEAAMSAQKYALAAEMAAEAQADSRLALTRAQLGAQHARIKTLGAENARLRRQVLQPEAPAAAPVPAAPAPAPAPAAPPVDEAPLPSWNVPATRSVPSDSTVLPDQVLPAPAPSSSAPDDQFDMQQGGGL